MKKISQDPVRDGKNVEYYKKELAAKKKKRHQIDEESAIRREGLPDVSNAEEFAVRRAPFLDTD